MKISIGAARRVLPINSFAEAVLPIRDKGGRMLQVGKDRGCARIVCWCLSVAAALAIAGVPQTAPAETPAAKGKLNLEERITLLSKGSSTEASQTQGLAELPFDKLAPDQQAEALGVLNNLSLFRELPAVAFQVDPAVHEYFLDHPEMAVSIWRAMKISKFQLKQTEPRVYHATDNSGTEGQVKILYRDRHQILAICDGVVKSPILPGSISAKTLLHLQRDFVKSQDESVWSRNRLRMYVALPSQAVETAAKVVAPLGNMIIDRNLREVCLFVGMMSAAMVHQPGWVEHIARQLDDVPKHRQNELIELTAQVFVAARKRELAKRKGDEPITLEDIIRPIRFVKDPKELTDECD